MPILETIALKGLTAFSTKLVSKFVDIGWTKLAEEFEASLSSDKLKEFCKACDEYVNVRTQPFQGEQSQAFIIEKNSFPGHSHSLYE